MFGTLIVKMTKWGYFFIFLFFCGWISLSYLFIYILCFPVVGEKRGGWGCQTMPLLIFSCVLCGALPFYASGLFNILITFSLTSFAAANILLTENGDVKVWSSIFVYSKYSIINHYGTKHSTKYTGRHTHFVILVLLLFVYFYYFSICYRLQTLGFLHN